MLLALGKSKECGHERGSELREHNFTTLTLIMHYYDALPHKSVKMSIKKTPVIIIISNFDLWLAK